MDDSLHINGRTNPRQAFVSFEGADFTNYIIVSIVQVVLHPFCSMICIKAIFSYTSAFYC